VHDLDRITQQPWEHTDQPDVKLLTQAQQYDETAGALGKKVKIENTTINTFSAINKDREHYNTQKRPPVLGYDDVVAPKHILLFNMT
jgi:hypothetical protein